MRRIPTILGIFLTLVLVAGLAFATSQVQKVTKIFSQADQSLAPTKIATGNISDLGFTVAWITSKEATGAVYYGKTPALGEGAAMDDRDLGGEARKYVTHFVRVTGLLPNTKYYYKVSSGTATFGDSTASDNPFSVTTGAKLATATGVDPIFGKVIDDTGGPEAFAVAIWEAPGATKIIALSKSDGGYVLPIGGARSTDLNSLFDTTSVSSETVTIIGGDGNPAEITCKVGMDRPLPTVKMGGMVNCSNPSPTPSSSFKTATMEGQLTVNVVEGETVSSSLPTISGQAGPGQVVKIEIHSDAVSSGTVKADPAGNWTWTPPANLSPGQHTVTLTVENADGTTQTITRTFYVAAGETILPVTSGTPSATLTHRACANYSCRNVDGAGPDLCTSDTECGTAPPVTPPAPPPVTGQTENTLALLTIGAVLGTLGLIFFRWTTQ
ncbi:fibronectin type III domain-containing protein [Candidatus Microgenomates bacterium]|nr:fibronectin type III domain-containing protein [Candidatus Microgenomates bacterium]